MNKLPINRNYCQCSGCSKYFNSVTAFDKHRRNFKCLTSDEMRSRKMVVNHRGYWISEPRGDL